MFKNADGDGALLKNRGKQEEKRQGGLWPDLREQTEKYSMALII